MFWFDALEDYHNPGTIYLFGKIYLEDEKRYVSCTVTVKNMLRCCFIAPRPFILDEHGDETSIQYNLIVYERKTSDSL